MIISSSVVRRVAASVEVVQWNYTDVEHLEFVHGGYKDSRILYENGLTSLMRIKTAVPTLRFLKIPTLVFVDFPAPLVQVTYASQMGIISRTTVTLNDVSKSETEVTVDYEFELSGWRTLLAPVLRRLIPKWNEKVWDEDLPLKLRREFVRSLGFIDFAGVGGTPGVSKPLMLPQRRPRGLALDSHPLRYDGGKRVSPSSTGK